MNLTLWVIAGLLAAVFAAAGSMKLFQPKEKIVASGIKWPEDVSDTTVKLIGAVEVLGRRTDRACGASHRSGAGSLGRCRPGRRDDRRRGSACAAPGGSDDRHQRRAPDSSRSGGVGAFRTVPPDVSPQRAAVVVAGRDSACAAQDVRLSSAA